MIKSWRQLSISLKLTVRNLKKSSLNYELESSNEVTN